MLFDEKSKKYKLQFLEVGGFKHEVQHGLTIDETPLRVF
jgi:hypothetical protein